MQKKVLNIGVVGGGSFGTALGTAAARCGNNVTLFTNNEQTLKEINEQNLNLRYFPKEIVLPKNLKASMDVKRVLSNSDIIIHAIPVQNSYDFLVENRDFIPDGIPYIIASKGILLKQKKFFSDVWSDIFEKKKVLHMILSGPSFAIEIMKKFPTLVSLGSKNLEKAKYVQDNLSNNEFKVLYTDDVKGVEIGGALKNPLAIGAGLIEGMGYSYNTVSALVTRGIYELSLFSLKFGGQQDTLFGLSGIGDVMLSSLGSLSRNKAVGIRLAKGETIENIMKSSNEVAEGVPTLLVLGEIIREYNLDMPIMITLYKVLTGEITPHQAQEILMKAKMGHENEMKNL